MNMFMMWMMGNSISLWTIMMVGAMMFSPVKSLMNIHLRTFGQSSGYVLQWATDCD